MNYFVPVHCHIQSAQTLHCQTLLALPPVHCCMLLALVSSQLCTVGTEIIYTQLQVNIECHG